MGTNANLAGTSGTNDMFVTNYPLAYPGLESPGTNSVYFGNLGTTERVAVNAPAGANPFAVQSGTIYYSYVFSVVNPAQMSTTGGFVTAFTTVTGASGTQPTVGGARLYMRLSLINSSTSYNVGIGKNPSAVSGVTWAPNELNFGDTNFIVASYTFLDGGASNDTAQLWIDPAPGTFGAAFPPTPDVTNTNGNDLQVGSPAANQLESFYFRQGNAAIPIIVATDLRIAYCWGCVTPPANPPTPSVPTLAIAPGSAGSVTLSWHTNTPCWSLQSRATLASTNSWATQGGVFTNTATTFGTTYNIPTNSTARYFRLKAIAN